MLPPNSMIEDFGLLADEFMLTVIQSKKNRFENGVVPFLTAHSLELAAKAAYIKVSPDHKLKKHGHNLRGLYKDLKDYVVGLSSTLPPESCYDRYKEFYGKLEGPTTISSLPPPETLIEYELCFYIENVVDLKYGYRKNMELLRSIIIEFEHINPKALELYALCRRQYQTPYMNELLFKNIESMFENSEPIKKEISNRFYIT